MGPSWHQKFVHFLSPLAFAAYLAMAVVWLTMEPRVALRPLGGATLLHALMGLYLAGFLLVVAASHRHRGYGAGITLMSLATHLVAAGSHSGNAGILYVVLASVLAAELSARRLVAVLLANNLALLAIVAWIWGVDWLQGLGIVAGLASFQAFAALVMRYAAQAQRMSDALAESNADLLATRSLLAETARDGERLRLSRELHDVAGHKLTALKLNLAALARDPRFRDEAAVPLCAQLADQLLADIRGVVQQMRHGDGLDLAPAMEALARPFPRPRLHLQIAPDARAGSLAQAEALLRAVQEGLTNAARHSSAQNLWVVLRRDGDCLRLDIRDDGRGQGPLQPGNGLGGMRERLESAGGGLDARRTDTGGVQLQAWLPVQA